MKKTILLPFVCLLLACQGESQQQRDERLGSQQLINARQALAEGNCDAARDTILALRHDHPLAINARQQAILLLDSVELQAAKDSLNALMEGNVDVPSQGNLEAPSQGSVDAAPHDSTSKWKSGEMTEQERLSVKVKFFERKLMEDQNKRH